MDPITVLVVDDHALFREGLVALLRDRPDIEVVGCAEDGAEAISMARALMPDIILMDVRMRGMDGLEATRLLKAEMPDVRVVMLTMSEEESHLFAAIKHGAQGYILKNTSAAELCRLLAGVRAGEAAISGLMAAKMLNEFARPGDPRDKAIERLTGRELDILQHLADGLTNREIAERLVISENTVKKHLRNILSKLHLQNRVQAALHAQRLRVGGAPR